LESILERNLIDFSTALPNIPISTPLQQSISGVQDILPSLFGQSFGAARGPAALLTGGGGPVPQFGRTQTREELGLPDRREYFPTTPTPEALEEADLIPPVRTTPGARQRARGTQRLERKEEKLGAQIERREARGAGTKRKEKKLSEVERRLTQARV
jgi:hypothetical protein